MTEGIFYNRPQLHTHVVVNYAILFLFCVYFSYFIVFSALKYNMPVHID